MLELAPAPPFSARTLGVVDEGSLRRVDVLRGDEITAQFPDWARASARMEIVTRAAPRAFTTSLRSSAKKTLMVTNIS